MNSAAASQPACRKLPTPTVLCIDDDPDITAAIELHMRKFDVKVVRAFHGMHGFSEATQHRPDVIVMDLAMPGGDGGAILECLRRNRQTANIPVIILTGMRDRRLAQTLKALGAERFVHKPIRLDELMQELARFIELRERVNDAST